VAVLAPHIPAGWRDVILECEPLIDAQPMYPSRPVAAGASVPLDYESLRDDLLADGSRDAVVLTYERGLRATTNQNHFVAQAIAEAANRWTEEEWLSRDERLFGLVVAIGALPERAAAEIRRSGANPRMVGVTLGSAALGSPLGHPVYHPIYKAAAELELPLVMQAGVDATLNAITTPVVGGPPATAGEFHALSWQTQMAHVSSLIMQGVFDRFPNLKVLLVGAGGVWLAGHLWRLDQRFSATRGDARWLRRRPIEYVDHFFLATHRLEQPPRPALLARALAVLPGVEDRLIYASGYPDSGWQDPVDATRAFPESWRAKVLHDNAQSFFRWGAQQAASPRDPIAATA
jgi:hypothetical protein